jgi:hypothetical protein
MGGILMPDEELLTTPHAAAYLGVSRQALTIAAERDGIGRKVPAIGRHPAYVYMFTRAELDAWKARKKNRGGRPKTRDEATSIA